MMKSCHVARDIFVRSGVFIAKRTVAPLIVNTEKGSEVSQ